MKKAVVEEILRARLDNERAKCVEQVIKSRANELEYAERRLVEARQSLKRARAETKKKVNPKKCRWNGIDAIEHQLFLLTLVVGDEIEVKGAFRNLVDFLK